jgi:hypothetical protein
VEGADVRVKAAELAGALKASAMFASTDKTRLHMNCVHIEATGSALRLVASDGHTLWCCEVPADPAPAHQMPWNVRLDDVETIARELKGQGVGPFGEIEIFPAKRQILGATYENASENFPPYASVLPAALEQAPVKQLPEFAAKYIARVCDALAAYGKGFAPELLKKGSKHEKEAARSARDGFLSPPIAWRVGGALDPAVFYSPKFPAAFALVMLRRGDGGAPSIEAFFEQCRERKGRAA